MEDGGFFGFDTSLPSVRRGPQQELGDVELEDTYDALNDETFGLINADEDWEEEHEKLAEYLGDIPTNEPSKILTVYELEDDEECAYSGPQPTNLRNTRIDNAGNVEFDIDNEDAANVAASVSQIILDDDDIESIISRPINYSQTMENKLFGCMSPQSSIFDTDFVGSPSTPSIWSTQLSDIRKPVEHSPKVIAVSNGNVSSPADQHNLMHGGLFKTVEELERGLLNQPKHLTMEELERNLLSQRSNGPVRSVEDIEAELTRHPQQMSMGPPPMHPFMIHPPPQMGISMPPPLRLPMPMPLPRMNVPLPLLPPTWSQRSNQARVNDDSRHDRMNSPMESYDEYCGLMSTKEKQWLMSIQINQLISDNPYVEDYYFTVLRLRCMGTLNQGREKREGPKLILPERAKIEAKTYAPTQFANSLGKLQVVTYTAPRRIIDVSIAQPTSEQDPQLAVKDMRKFKQILLDIEKMYLWLLDLDDAEMRLESLPEDTEPGLHHQAAADYQHKLQNFLSSGDRLQQVMFVRKGRLLVLRAWCRLTLQCQELIVRTMLLNCISLVRRDANDHILVRFLPLVNDILVSQSDLKALVNMAQLIDTAQKSSGHVSITSTKMGVDLISLIMCRGSELAPKCSDELIRRQWSAFVCSVGNAILATPSGLKSDLGLLNLEPFQQVGMDDCKLAALKPILDKLSSVGK